MAKAVQITLTDEERAELEARAAKLTLAHRDVQRAKIVLLAAQGLSNTEIAARLDMSAKVVGQWRRRFADKRLDGLRDEARPGRPGRFPPGGSHRGQSRRLRAAGRGRPALAALDG